MMVRSRKLMVNQKQKRLQVALETAEEFAQEMKLDRKHTVRLRLLTEETMGMLKEMTGEYRASLWFEGQDDVCELHLDLETDMDAKKKEEILSVSTSGKNEAAHGFMGRIRNMVEDLMYGLTDSDMMTDDDDYVWTLDRYREEMKNDSVDEDPWVRGTADELERSIVANVADDILVGVSNNSVEMTIRMKR